MQLRGPALLRVLAHQVNQQAGLKLSDFFISQCPSGQTLLKNRFVQRYRRLPLQDVIDCDLLNDSPVAGSKNTYGQCFNQRLIASDFFVRSCSQCLRYAGNSEFCRLIALSGRKVGYTAKDSSASFDDTSTNQWDHPSYRSPQRPSFDQPRGENSFVCNC